MSTGLTPELGEVRLAKISLSSKVTDSINSPGKYGYHHALVEDLQRPQSFPQGQRATMAVGQPWVLRTHPGGGREALRRMITT